MIKTLFGGMIFAAMVVSSHSGSAPHAYVDRTSKGDRLPMVQQAHVLRQTTARPKLPAGCDPIVSPLASRDLAKVAARCDS